MIVSILILLYLWVGYPFILWAIRKLRAGEAMTCAFELKKGETPSVAVIIAAHNEAANIQRRIDNILDTNYATELITIVVASDGSTDDTLSLANAHPKNERIEAIEVVPQGGRAAAHNFAMQHLSSLPIEIAVFTDAETRFDCQTLGQLIAPFACPDVGYVAGRLYYDNQDSTAITKSTGLYWRFEQMLRRFENDLGVFVFGTGACCAVRTSLYKAIPPTGDVDFTTPLDTVLAGFSCVQSASASAWDIAPSNPKQEFRSRVRMTSKNLYGTLSRWGIRGYVNYPIYSCVIWSHKIGRWMTPFLLIALLIGTLASLPSFLAVLLLILQLGFYGAGALSASTGAGGRIPALISTFLLANIGFMMGVFRVLTLRVPSAYVPISQTDDGHQNNE